MIYDETYNASMHQRFGFISRDWQIELPQF